jgi:small-conductance mechanosensitive channel
VVIPNANLFTSPVIVNTAFPSRRMELDFDCPPERDVERLRAAVGGAVATVDGVIRDPPPDVLLVGLAGTAAKLRVRWWMEPPRKEDAIAVRSRVLGVVRQALLAPG